MEAIHLPVTYKGTKHNVSLNPQAPLANFRDILQGLTNVPPSRQKLIYRGSRPFSGEADSVTVADAGLKSGLKVTLMGSTNEELDILRNADNTHQRKEEIRRQREAAISRGKEYASQLVAKLMHPPEETYFKIHRIEPSPSLPDPEAARGVLESLAADPAIKYVMMRYQLQVGILTELAPQENPTLLGLNFSAGLIIKLRLRTDTCDGMRPYKEIRRAFCHGLAHNVFGDHGDKFKALDLRLNLEIEQAEFALALESRMLADIGYASEPNPSRSTGLMNSEVHSNVLDGGIETASLEPMDEETRRRVAQANLERQLREEQEIEDHCGSEVHSNVLDGGLERASALKPIDEEMRRRAAQAELKRQLREEQEMEDHCGSEGPAALK